MLINKNLDKETNILNTDSTIGDTFEHWGSNQLCKELLGKKSWINLDEGLRNTVKAYNDSNWFDDRL